MSNYDSDKALQDENRRVEWDELGSWLAVVEHEANEREMHLSILRFTNGWKAVLGTPRLGYFEEGSDYHRISTMQAAKTIEEACWNLIVRERWLNDPRVGLALKSEWGYRQFWQEMDAEGFRKANARKLEKG